MSEIRQIQVDGVNYDLVITEDEPSATRAEQAAAQAQQYASSASSSAVTAYGYMEAAEDAADRAEAIVGGQFVSYGQTQSLTDAQKTIAKDNIGVTESGNKNLLDNWYFIDPVNSRALSYYTDTNYTIDRWRFWESGSSLTLTSNGVVFANSGTINGLFQYLEPKRFQSLYGKTITISAIIDGTLYSQTGTASDNCDITCVISGNTYFKYYCNGSDGHFRFNVADGSSITIKAAKLEIGSISTLEKDAAPNKGEELTKCISVVPLYGDTCTNTGYGRTNPNLLDNWYWVGGGTAGKFPVNQRGKNYYENHDYTIDRWKSDSPWESLAKVATQEGGVVIAGQVESTYPNSYVELTQYIDNPPVGKTVTVSVLADIVSPDSEGEYPYVWINALEGMQIASTGLTSRTFVFPSGGTTFRITVPSGATTASSIRIQAVKLEVGSSSTLLQDAAPDYGVELTRCLYSKADSADSYSNNGFGRSNRNLLDNWYFVGGGSQLGDGVFPINQRGQTSYTGGITGFDRWTVDGGDFTATLESGGVRVTSTTPYAGLSQILPAYKLQNGETYTYSIVVDGVLHTATFVANSDGNWANIYYGEDWYVPYQFINGKWTFKIINTLTSNGMNHLISKAKLEKGTVSTLANDPPPDFGEELRKCQMYLRSIYARSVGTYVGIGMGFSTNSYEIELPFSMRATPTASYSGTIEIYAPSGTHTVSAVSVVSASTDTVELRFTVSGTVTTYENGHIYMANGAKILLSAEL